MQHVHTLRVDLHRISVDDPVIVAGGMGHGIGSKLASDTSSVTIEYLGVG